MQELIPEARPGLLGRIWNAIWILPEIYLYLTATPALNPNPIPYTNTRTIEDDVKAIIRWVIAIKRLPPSATLNKIYILGG